MTKSSAPHLDWDSESTEQLIARFQRPGMVIIIAIPFPLTYFVPNPSTAHV